MPHHPHLHRPLLSATPRHPFLPGPRAPWLYWSQNHFSSSIQTQTPARAQQLQAPVPITDEVGSVQHTGKGSPGHQGCNLMTGAAHDFRPKAQHENELLSPELRGTSSLCNTLCFGSCCYVFCTCKKNNSLQKRLFLTCSLLQGRQGLMPANMCCCLP